MAKRNFILRIVMPALLAIFSYVVFHFLVPPHLGTQQSSLWALGSLGAYFDKPAALACLLNDFLIDIFDGNGDLIVSFLLLLEWWSVFLVFRRFSNSSYLEYYALLPALVEAILFCNQSYTLVSSLSLLLVLWLFLFFTCFHQRWFAFVMGIVLIPVVYILAGGRSDMYILLVLVYEVKQNREYWWIWLLILLPICGFIPALLGKYYQMTVEQAYIYPFNKIIDFLPSISIAFIILFFFEEMKVLSKD